MDAALPDSGRGLRLAALALAWLGGVALQLQQPELWPAAIDLALALAGVGLLLGAALLPAAPGAPRWIAVALALILLGFALTAGRALLRLEERLPARLEGQDLELSGVVASLPRRTPEGTRFVFEVAQARRGDQRVDEVPGRLSLGWYRGWHEDVLVAHPSDALRAGQRWRFTVRLKQPHGSLNPHGLDHELQLFEQGLRATGYVRATAAQPALLLEASAAHPVERLRQRLRDAIERRVEDRRAAGVLAALAVGDQSAIESDDWELFRNTGIAHLVAISGLHITMFAWLAGAALAALWRRSERLMLAVPAPAAGRWGGLLAAAAYAVLAGWGVPAQRTVWMLASAVLLQSLALRWPWPLVLLAAGTVVSAIDPWALLQPGFWLSFVAVGLLMASAPGQPAGREAADEAAPSRLQRLRSALAARVRSGLRTQAVATLGLAPLTLIFFQQIALLGFVANLIAIPLVTLLVTPLALLGALLPPLWSLAALLVQGLSTVLAGLAASPHAVWQGAVATPVAQALGLLGGLLLVLPLPWRARLLALPLLLPMLWPPLPRPAPGEFELLALDVGQGSAALVRTRGHLLLHDAGPRYSRERDAGERVLLPLLRGRGERRVDMLVLSHRDSDHVGGAASLLDGVAVAELRSSLEEGHALRRPGLPHRRCDDGQAWTWDGVRFELLHPRAEDHLPGARPNTLSCVLRVTDGAGRAVLLTGDIEAAQEAALVSRHGPALRSALVVVPHHGSRTSSSPALVAAAAPALAFVQAGYRNRFGHPLPEVVARWRGAGAVVVRSEDCGALHWSAGAVACERERRRRYWHHRAEADVAALPPP